MTFLLWHISVSSVKASQAGVWYVATTGNDTGECNTVQSACKTISTVFGKASFEPGDTILIDSGIYSSPEIGLIASVDVALSGGWDSTFTTQSGYTDIEGDRNGVIIQPGVTITMSRMLLFGYNDTAVVNLGVLILDDFYVRGVYSGSGIENYGSATLTNGKLSDSPGVGIANSGEAELTEVVISYNRGNDIVNNGVMTITRSAVGQNGFWGTSSIGNSGTLTIRDSAIVNNNNAYPTTATALYNSGNTTLINTTVSGSSGGMSGTIYNAGGAELRLFNTSVTYNVSSIGSGIYNAPGGIVTLQNSILAQNGASQNDNCAGDPIQSLGYNLIEDTTGCTIIPGPGDLLNVSALIFPHPWGVGAWYPANEEDNFSPLAFSSPAVNGGNPAGCFDDQGAPILTDQRGLPRTGACDIGAYEYIAAFDPLEYLWLPAALRFSP